MSPLNPSVSHWITQYVVIVVFKRNYIRPFWQVVAYTFYQVSKLIVLNNLTTVQVYNQLNEVVNRNMFNIARLMSCHNIRKTLSIAVFHFRFVLPTRKYVHYVLTTHSRPPQSCTGILVTSHTLACVMILTMCRYPQ